MGKMVTIDTAILQPNYHPEEIERKEPYKIAVAAPSFPMINHVILNSLCAAIPQSLKLGEYHYTNHLQKVRGVHGETHIRFISAKNPETWYGEKLHFVWVDEFPLIKELMFDEIQTRLTPLAGQRPGRLILTGTPQGQNWAHKRIYLPWVKQNQRSSTSGLTESSPALDRSQSPKDSERALDLDFFTWHTIDNPHLDKNYVEMKRKTLPPKYFTRTFEADWGSFEGQVFEEFLREVHVKPIADYKFVLPTGTEVGYGREEVRLKVTFAGVDWGFGTDHPGAIVVLGQDYNGQFWVLEDSLEEGLLLEGHRPTEDSWVNRARKLRNKWNVHTWYCDHRPDNVKIFNRATLNAEMALKDIDAGIMCIAEALHITDDGRTNFFILDKCVATIEEIVYYHWEEGKERPAKVRDHTMDALRYAMYTHQQRGGFDRELGYLQ